MEKIINLIASGFGIAYIPVYLFKRKGKFKGCGFFGTIFALLTYDYLIPQNFKIRIIIIIIYLILSVFISQMAFKDNQEKDNPLIVIDEIVGYFSGFIFIEKDFKSALILFVLFRLFDTTKPFPIKKLENIKNKGLSIVIDDLVAGLYAGVLTYVIIFFMI